MKASGASAEQVVGVGVDFTSCTMLPAFADGTPVCLFERFTRVPLAYPKLWKHHGARPRPIASTTRTRANEPWLRALRGDDRLEWFFPKVFETLNHEPGVYDAADVWLEAGDWFVWQLTNGPYPDCSPDKLVRSTCQAGYKAQWNAQPAIHRRSSSRRSIPRWRTSSRRRCPAHEKPRRSGRRV
jgi:L-ribulokinase